MNPDIKDLEYWDRLKKKIKTLGIFNSDDYSNPFLVRRVECRMRVLNLDSYSKFGEVLAESEDERKKLLKELTIHVTHFFRDNSVFDVIKKEVLPILIELKRKKNDHKLKIWCAGCSSGEEAYTMAIVLKEFLGSKFKEYDITFIATDIDKASVERAKQGIYEAAQFKETYPEYISKYFDKEDELYKVKKELRDIIEFKQGNILSVVKPKQLDIILCRNVVIYFDKGTKEKLYGELFNNMINGGFFIMGKTETILGPSRENFQIFNGVEKIYFKE